MGFLALDAQRRVQDVNRMALGFLGVTKARILGSPIDSESMIDRTLLDAILSDESVSVVDITYRGGQRILEVDKRPVRLSSGESSGDHPGYHSSEEGGGGDPKAGGSAPMPLPRRQRW